VTELVVDADLGLGTFDALDGEMVLLDGTVWQIPADGVPVEAAPEATTPFAQVVQFRPEDEPIEVDEPTTCEELEARIDEEVGTTADVVALRVEADFEALEIRSERAQTEPYQPLEQVLETDQVSWDLEDVSGTMVGFRTADALESVSPPGYHFHMLTDDQQHGGHVLSCEIGSGTVQVDPTVGVDLTLGGEPPAE
jgi:acetolactate decarboxylase